MLRPDKHSQARKTPDAHTKGNRMKIGKHALGLAFLLLAGAGPALADAGDAKILTFELWNNGKPVDPEGYIVF